MLAEITYSQNGETWHEFGTLNGKNIPAMLHFLAWCHTAQLYRIANRTYHKTAAGYADENGNLIARFPGTY